MICSKCHQEKEKIYEKKRICIDCWLKQLTSVENFTPEYKIIKGDKMDYIVDTKYSCASPDISLETKKSKNNSKNKKDFKK